MNATPVSKVMSQPPIVTYKNTTLSEVRKIFHQYPIHHLLIIDKDSSELVGLISSHDLLQVSLKAQIEEDPQFLTCAEDIMITEIASILPSASIQSAADFLSKNAFHSLPVVDEENKLVGMLTTSDLIHFLAKQG